MTGDTQELWATQASYTGMDTTTVTGPGTEAAVSIIVNLDGNTEQRSLFHGTAPTGAADVSTYIYDRFGQLTRMGDGANLWTWTYDAAGRELSATDPDSGTITTVYDASGRTASATDAMGTVTGYAYDTLDRTTAKTVTVSGGTAKTLETHTYDQEVKGQPSSSTRNNGAAYDQPVTTAFSGYNNAYQPSTTTVTLPAGLTGFAGSYTNTRSYTTSGKLRTSVSPAIGGLPAEEVRYGYDEFENPSSTWNTTGDQFGGTAQYDNLGFLTTFLQSDAKAGDGSSTSNTTGTNNVYFGWDAATGRLNGQWATNNTRGTISDLGKTTYTYSASGKLTARELTFSSRPGVASDYQCYDYDYASRLEAVWTPASKSCTTAPTTASTSVAGLGGPAAYAQTYGYTAAGDRSQVKRFDANGALAVTEQYNYSAPGTAGPHQVGSVVSTPGAGGAATTQTFTWDAAGKMIGRAGQTLTYTPDGLLATSTGTSAVPANPNPGAANGTPAGPTTGAGSLGTRFYDAAGNLVGIVDGTGTTVTLGSVTAHSTPGGVKTATCTYDFAGKTVAQRTAAAGVVKLSFIIGDSVNTAQTMTQPTVGAGAITAVQRYTDPFGLARGANLTGTGNNAYTAAGATTAGVGSNAANPNGFAAANGYIAGLDDTVSSLTHLGARDLDPVTGAFTTPDPVLDTSNLTQFSAYQYAGNDPINRSDSTGLMDMLDSLVFAAGFVVAVTGIAIATAGTVATAGVGGPATVPGGSYIAAWGAAMMGGALADNAIKNANFSIPSPSLQASGSSAAASGGSMSYQPAIYASGDVFISYPTSAVRTVAGGIGGGYLASSLGGTRFTSPAVRQGGQSTGDTRGADTGAALAAQNAVMHAASVAATNAIGLANQAAASAARFSVSSNGTAIDTQAVRPPGPYSRPSGATTKAQRQSVQGQTCVDCGMGGKMNADHITPLSLEFWRTGTIDLLKMRSLDAVQPQCPTCSNIQGGRLSQFSKVMKGLWGF